MKCPTCESCEYAQYCGATEIMRKCERHNKKVEQTNEEWFCGLSTWEKANVIAIRFGGDEDECQKIYFDFGEWLKQPHTIKE